MVTQHEYSMHTKPVTLYRSVNFDESNSITALVSIEDG